jgi:hypothetical protein
VAHDRRRWRVWQRYMDPARFVFLDETGASTNMIRRYGRCPRGERLVDATPWGHWKITTFVAGLRSTGVVAPLVLDGPMTGEVFRAYVEQMLAPALQPGDVVVMDMCGRPLGSKKNLQARCGASSGADMCPASAAAGDVPRARMGVCGSGPLQPRALEALVHDLAVPNPSLDRCAILSV